MSIKSAVSSNWSNYIVGQTGWNSRNNALKRALLRRTFLAPRGFYRLNPRRNIVAVRFQGKLRVYDDLLYRQNYPEAIKWTSVVSNTSFNRLEKKAESVKRNRLKQSMDKPRQLRGCTVSQVRLAIPRPFINRFRRDYLDVVIQADSLLPSLVPRFALQANFRVAYRRIIGRIFDAVTTR